MLKGHVDRISDTVIAGWAGDTAQPDRPIDINVFIEDREPIRVTCDQPRNDLGKERLSGRHGFSIRLDPPPALDTSTRISVRFAESGVVLGRGDALLSRQGLAHQPVMLASDLARALVLPPPRSPRSALSLFGQIDPRFGLYDLLNQVAFDGFSERMLHRVLGGPNGGAGLDETPLSRQQVRDRAYHWLSSKQFQDEIVLRILDQFPEKRRLIFVHIPKCAGSDLSAHLARRVPELDQRLRERAWIGLHAFAQELGKLIRTLPLFDDIFVHGHVGLDFYTDHQLLRPADGAFTLIRDPLDIPLSQVNYILTRISRTQNFLAADPTLGAAAVAPDVRAWLDLLGLDQPLEVTEHAVRKLLPALIERPEFLQADPLSSWLGGGSIEQVIERLACYNVELVPLDGYRAWLRERWGIVEETRENASTRFVVPDMLSGSQLARLRALGEKDAGLYQRVQEVRRRTGRPSVRGPELLGS